MSTPGKRDFEQETIAILKDITKDWDSGFDGGITADTRIVGDMGFESIDVVILVTAIETHVNRRDLPFENLLMTEGRYVDDLSVREIAAFLAQHVA